MEGQAGAQKSVKYPRPICKSPVPIFFDTLKISLVAGRIFSDTDGANAAPAAVISPRDGLAFFWPKGDAIGHRIKTRPPGLGGTMGSPLWEWSGMFARNWWNSLTRPVIYRPFGQSPETLHDRSSCARTANIQLPTSSAVRDVVRQMDPGIALRGINTFWKKRSRIPSPSSASWAFLNGDFRTGSALGACAFLFFDRSLRSAVGKCRRKRTHENRYPPGRWAPTPRDLMKLILGAKRLKLTGIGLGDCTALRRWPSAGQWHT